MIITLLACSTRADAQSRRVADVLAAQLEALGASTRIVDLFEQKLPLFDASGSGTWESVRDAIVTDLAACDGAVFVSPEWDGMMSAGLVNLFHYINKELADKPVLPIGVSAGRGGQYPLLQLRMMGYKNKRFVLIPESLVVSDVHESVTDGAFSNDYLAKRSDYALRVLLAYAKALRSVRESGVIDYETFANGM